MYKVKVSDIQFLKKLKEDVYDLVTIQLVQTKLEDGDTAVDVELRGISEDAYLSVTGFQVFSNAKRLEEDIESANTYTNRMIRFLHNHKINGIRLQDLYLEEVVYELVSF